MSRTRSATKPTATTNEYTLIQYNFALFFGLAVQLYEATLVSDDTPWDRFRREHPPPTDPALNPWTNTSPNHISRLALFGAHLFNDRTRGPTNIRCSNCHEQAELTDASVRRIAAAVNGPVRNRDGNIIDKGFNNIGVRPTDDDLGVGASDVFGPLSLARRLFPGAPPADLRRRRRDQGLRRRRRVQDPVAAQRRAHRAVLPQRRRAHAARGGRALQPRRQRRSDRALDGTPIEPLGVPTLTADEIDAIVAFLESAHRRARALPARAVRPPAALRAERPSGRLDARASDANGDGLADDVMVEIPAVGAAGGAPLPGLPRGRVRALTPLSVLGSGAPIAIRHVEAAHLDRTIDSIELAALARYSGPEYRCGMVRARGLSSLTFAQVAAMASFDPVPTLLIAKQRHSGSAAAVRWDGLKKS